MSSKPSPLFARLFSVREGWVDISDRYPWYRSQHVALHAKATAQQWFHFIRAIHYPRTARKPWHAHFGNIQSNGRDSFACARWLIYDLMARPHPSTLSRRNHKSRYPWYPIEPASSLLSGTCPIGVAGGLSDRQDLLDPDRPTDN